MRTSTYIGLLGGSILAVLLGVMGCSGIDRSDAEGPNSEALQATTHGSITFGILAGVPDEHCRLSATRQSTYGAGNQIRISSGSHLGLCTVDTTTHGDGDDTVYLNGTYAYRRLDLSSGTVSGSISNEDGSSNVRIGKSKNFPVGAIQNEAISQDVFEYLEHQNGTKVVYTAPHGQIEYATDRQVDRIVKTNNPSRNSAWVLRYDTTETGPVSPVDFNHFHITSTDINETSFPDLDTLLDAEIPYAVSFHGFSAAGHDVDNSGYGVIVGGGETALFREGMAQLIEIYLNDAVPAFGYKKAWYDLPNLPSNDAGLAGTSSANFVNRLAAGGRGVQLEQLYDLRNSSTARDALTDAVKSVYDCLLDTADSTATMSSSSLTVNGSGTGYASSGTCLRWIAEIDVTSATSNLTIDADAASCSDGTTVHVDIYKERGDGTWDRVGGGNKTHALNGGNCEVSNVTGYDTVTAQAGESTYRVVVRSILSGSPTAAKATLSY